MASARVTLERHGRFQDISLEQITVENLRRMFQVNPQEVWLRDSIEDTAFFPEPDGTFNLPSADSGFAVEGPPQPTTTLPRLSRYNSPGLSPMSLSSSQSANPPSFHSVVSASKRQSAGCKLTVKVMKAKMTKSRSKPLFDTSSAMHVEVTEETANINHIVQSVKDLCGSQYIVVTVDGLEMEDSPATRGKLLHIHIIHSYNNFNYLLLYRTNFLEEPATQVVCRGQERSAYSRDQTSNCPLRL